jgi:PAS domain S-box-containing protein
MIAKPSPFGLPELLFSFLCVDFSGWWMGAAVSVLASAVVLCFGWHYLFLMRQNRNMKTALEKQQGTEEALQHERTVMKGMVESSPIGITVVNANGQVVFANPKAEEVLGLEQEQVGQRLYNAKEWHITDLAGNPFPDQELPFQRVMSTGQPVYDIQHAIEGPKKKRKVLSINAAPILNAALQPAGMVAAITDITEKKMAEEELQKSEEKFSKAFRACPEAISIASMEDGRYIDVNEAFLKKTGFQREEVIGHTSAELNVWVDRGDRQRFVEELAKEGSLRSFEVRYRIRCGEVRSFLVSSEAIRLQGQPCSLNFIIDITERKQAEEELKRQMEELAAWHQVTLGRESRVLELKSEVNELLTKLNQPARY